MKSLSGSVLMGSWDKNYCNKKKIGLDVNIYEFSVCFKYRNIFTYEIAYNEVYQLGILPS